VSGGELSAFWCRVSIEAARGLKKSSSIVMPKWYNVARKWFRRLRAASFSLADAGHLTSVVWLALLTHVGIR